jgi:RNA-directed DNA polymerase
MQASYESLIECLAEAFLSGPWEVSELVERASLVLGKRYRWLRPLARRVVVEFGSGKRTRVVQLCEFLSADKGLQKAFQRYENLSVHFVRWAPPVMVAAYGPPTLWKVPAITTPAELAGFLNITPGELDWFADIQGRERVCRVEPLRHYRYRWVTKRYGSFRLIEAPKPRLKEFQRVVLDAILAHIPSHESAHGFRPGRSISTFVAAHVAQPIVLKMDLRDFFVSITRARVTAIFLTAGYPEPVARLLAGLCTNTVPAEVLNRVGRAAPESLQPTMPWQDQRPYCVPHLPQGSPTSPALANLAAYRFDVRLAALSAAAGACYTRYADDLLFSGDQSFARSVRRYLVQVAAIAIEEGFAIAHRKTRVMRQGVSQRAAGIVINQKINMPRDDYDRLKAILCNCVKHGPAEQNRSGVADFRAHLAGRVAHAARLSPHRGEKLNRLLERIVW